MEYVFNNVHKLVLQVELKYTEGRSEAKTRELSTEAHLAQLSRREQARCFFYKQLEANKQVVCGDGRLNQESVRR